MGNCMSTCCGRRKRFELPDFEMVTLPRSNEGESLQLQQHSPDLTTLPIGIALTTNEVIAAPVPVINETASNQAPIVNETTSNQAPGGNDPPVDEDSHSLTNSLQDVTINNIQVETARPVNYSRPGAYRLVTSTSAVNIRDLRETSCGDVSPPRLRPSATMSNLKPLPKYPNDDPVAAYIAREHMMLEEAWKILVPDKAFIVDFNRERNVRRPRILRGSVEGTSSNDVKNDVKNDAPVKDENNNMEAPEKINEIGGTGATQEVGEDSENPKILIRILRQKILQLDDMMSQVRTGEVSIKPIPNPDIDDANDPDNPATSSPIRRSNNPDSAVNGTSDISEPSIREAEMDMSSSNFVGSPHRMGLPRRPRPVGIIGPSTPTGSFDQPTELHHETHSRDDLDTETEHPLMLSEAGPCQSVIRDTLPQVPSGDEERDHTLYAVALEDVTKNYHEAKPVILAKVRRFVASERTVVKVVETILAMTDDVIDACVNDENSLEIVQMMVTGSCQGSELIPSGKITPTFKEKLDKEAEAAKERKAIALLEKWAAEAKAKEEAEEKAKEKGKGKEKAE
ncbi:hypothetical protein F4813DRAFT_390403 [Daldinia decipiens]|uniref:uncharacterized protein n=1 Tax=Daldinia decipiens TaxID=326647 RepID=UPI0020C31042|nr:uncharacterized protein F4813DRAFT_390403 [Daldinia decipiens]KAI1656696.1 hypothetical protein F4813DRAFT_390403 [Daldinia decipiens]